MTAQEWASPGCTRGSVICFKSSCGYIQLSRKSKVLSVHPKKWCWLSKSGWSIGRALVDIFNVLESSFRLFGSLELFEKVKLKAFFSWLHRGELYRAVQGVLVFCFQVIMRIYSIVLKVSQKFFLFTQRSGVCFLSLADLLGILCLTFSNSLACKAQTKSTGIFEISMKKRWTATPICHIKSNFGCF